MDQRIHEILQGRIALGAGQGGVLIGAGRGGAGAKPAGDWISFVKHVAAKERLSYKDAMMVAAPMWKRMKRGLAPGQPRMPRKKVPTRKQAAAVYNAPRKAPPARAPARAPARRAPAAKPATKAQAKKQLVAAVKKAETRLTDEELEDILGFEITGSGRGGDFPTWEGIKNFFSELPLKHIAHTMGTILAETTAPAQAEKIIEQLPEKHEDAVHEVVHEAAPAAPVQRRAPARRAPARRAPARRAPARRAPARRAPARRAPARKAPARRGGALIGY